MATLKDSLDAFEGQPEQPWKVRKHTTVSESGQRYEASFIPDYMSAIYGIDGGVIKDKTICKCDKLLLVDRGENGLVGIFVELKGQNMNHAIKQLEDTLNHSLFKNAVIEVKHARVIGRRIPKNAANSTQEIAKKRFLVKYNCRLEIKGGPYKETFRL